MIDTDHVTRILVNLIGNAIKYTPEGGKVDLSVSARKLRSGRVRHEYVVSDNGTGMSDEFQKRMFEPFEQETESRRDHVEGQGLGLFIVKQLVDAMQGKIGCVSEPGKGTTFTICLPRYVGDAAAMASGVGMGLPVHGNGETLLVVEDETVILSIVKRNLEKLGYRVFSAGLPKQALELAEKHTGEIQLLITDVVMPEMNGKELSQLLQARDPKMKVLFMSGYTADAMAHHGMLEEGVHFLQKPFTTVDLAKKVRQALDQL